MIEKIATGKLKDDSASIIKHICCDKMKNKTIEEINGTLVEQVKTVKVNCRNCKCKPVSCVSLVSTTPSDTAVSLLSFLSGFPIEYIKNIDSGYKRVICKDLFSYITG